MLSLFIIIYIALILIFSICLLSYRKKLIQKDIEINQITLKLDEAHKKIIETERRKSFRLKINIEECELQIVKIGDKKMDLLKDRKGPSKIKDLSFTGLQLESMYDLPIKDRVEVNVKFKIDVHMLEMRGLLIRKEEHLHRNNFIYGIKFLNPDPKKQTILNSILRRKELASKR